MSDLIYQVSQIHVSQSFLDQIDIKSLLEDLKKKFVKLDDFQKTRSEYENRSFMSKVGDALIFDDTLEKAHLDAVETQAAFSKAVGQLLVLSIAQSQRLQEQQEQLTHQQKTIANQTRIIERNTFDLQTQTETLEKQNNELSDLLKKLFELKGLTDESSKKLILMAIEVENTKDKLVDSVQDSMSVVSKQLEQTLTEVIEKNSLVEVFVDEQVERMDRHCSEITSNFQKINNQWDEQKAKFEKIKALSENGIPEIKIYNSHIRSKISYIHFYLGFLTILFFLFSFFIVLKLF